MVHKVEKELIKALDYEPSKKAAKDDQVRLTEILEAAVELPEDDYNELSEDAQLWVVKAGDSYNDKEDLPDFDEVDYEEAEEPAPKKGGKKAARDEDEDDEKPAKGKGKASKRARDEDEPEDDPDDVVEEDEEDGTPVDPDDDEDNSAPPRSSRNKVKTRAKTGDEDETETRPIRPKANPEPKRGAKASADEDEDEDETPKKGGKKASKPDTTKPKRQGPQAYANAKKDRFGLVEGSKVSQAVKLFARSKGATMAEIKEATGGPQGNVLRKLVEEGHRVERDGRVIRVIHKDDAKAAKASAKASKREEAEEDEDEAPARKPAKSARKR